MRRRWTIKEGFIPQLKSYRIFAPDDALNINDLFDLVTKTVLHKENIEPYIRFTVGHGMALLGLDKVKMTQVWLDEKADDAACIASLSFAETEEDEMILERLWGYRHRLALLPESWRHVIEGHPVLGRIRYNPDRLELATIADGIIATARGGMETMQEIDKLILKIWGVSDALPQKSMQELANIYPEVLELNEWYSYKDFGLEPRA